ncbi:actin-binding LIM protein 3 isoform X2 [Amyelois transitella]|uniref:actin-binding LIM protein 3 isoform X2 n=1 Tax=Amyelois transitella TaxID=680683 RepID=UPI00298FB691|nr:actin-binding LIM protein 3 isoform X2 [Amyelois transitella]
MSYGGVPYCERDYQRLYGVRCAHCDRFVSGRVLQVSDIQYMSYGGVPYCERDYQRLYGVRCAHCDRFVSGRVLQVSDIQYMSYGGVPYCERDYQRLYGVRCAHCDRFVSGRVLQVSDIQYMSYGGVPYCERDYQRLYGVRCAHCDRFVSGRVLQVSDIQYMSYGGVPYCERDYQRLYGVRCAHCDRFVSGRVLQVSDIQYMSYGGVPYCERDYQRLYGVRCAHCDRFVSGRVLQVSDIQYMSYGGVPYCERDYQRLYGVRCAHCDRFVSGRVLQVSDIQYMSYGGVPYCERDYQRLYGVRCAHCDRFVSGRVLQVSDIQYMSYGGVPYCERDYQRLYGVRCAHCDRFVSGRVLQAGENHHYHTACARCIKCGDSFGEGEDMYLHGAAIWHPRCGPPPHDLRSADRASSEMQFSLRSRTPSVNGSYCSPYSSLTRKFGSTSGCTSPGLQLRERGSREHTPQRVTAYSYLLNETPTLRRPLQPYDRAPASPHFHRPPSQSSRPSSRAGASSKSSHRPGMRVLVDSMRSETPRPKSPHMNNEEPIELSHYPAAYKPPPGTQPKIERDDFPAPPYPYTDPERRRRWSDTYKGVESDSDEPQAGKDEADKQELTNGQLNGHADSKLVKERTELSKIQSGIAQVFLKEVKEREKMQQWKKQNLDPRNASRTPSAAREPVLRLRYPSPLGASPSRSLDRAHAHPHQPAAAHSHMHIPPYHVYHETRPGSGLRSSTLPAAMTRHNGDFTFSGMGDKTHSTDFSSGKSDISAGSITDVDRSAATTTDGILAVHVRPAGSALGGAHGGAGLGPRGSSGGVRRSLPNMATSHLVHEPAKLYPYHLLLSSNYRLPPDCDRLNLERHLSDAEFEAVLQLRRPDFYRLPQWRRHELKRRALLF